MKLFKLSILYILLLLTFTTKAVASEEPAFGSCLNPQGEIVASYGNGTHGVPGRDNSYTGTDNVYSIGNGNYAQCLCPDGGNGIQTNWLKVSADEQDKIKVYQSQGWIYIPDGSAWGLSADPYLAMNSEFACNPQIGGGQGDGRSDGLSDGRSDGRSSGSSTPSTGVLGLATTGNTLFIWSVLLTGTILLSAGIIVSKKNKTA